jgi:hypothetical protein
MIAATHAMIAIDRLVLSARLHGCLLGPLDLSPTIRKYRSLRRYEEDMANAGARPVTAHNVSKPRSRAVGL